MRILSVGNFGSGWDGSICDEEHIAGALEELGHEVFRQQREWKVYDYRGIKFDFILIAQWDNYAPMLLPNMKDQDGCPIVYWAYDHQADGQEWHERLVEGADLYLSKRIADSKYDNWAWCSQDFSPNFLTKAPEVEKDIDVLFTGSYLGWASERNDTLKAVGEKFNLTIHSVNQWPQGNEGPRMDVDLPELYARAKIVLSIDHTIEAGYWSDRVAQALCCGAFVMHRYQPLSEVHFKDNVVYFYNVADCLEKIAHYLEDEDSRLAISRRGYIYAQANLKVKNRVQDLLTIVESVL